MNVHINPTSFSVERSRGDDRFSVLHLDDRDSFVLVWFENIGDLENLRNKITEYLDAQPKESTP
jgi:hypothetical protein